MNLTTTRPVRILVVDDEAPIREVLSASLKDEGHIVQTASEGEAGLKMMESFRPEIVFLDIWMPGSLDGIEVLTTARQRFPDLDFVMISGHGTIETAVRATKLGAWDFIEKPLSMDKILIAIANITQYQQERQDKQALLNRLRTNFAIIGDSSAMMQLKQVIARVAPAQSWVLFSGENGAGKELFAKNIHYLSPRASRPFVDIHVNQIPPELVEAELFGFERDAFPGAEKAQKGKIELANGGTVFIDDIAQLSPGVQRQLHQLMQEKSIKRVGGTEKIPCDVRLIAATATDIEKEAHEGRFSADLKDRLMVMSFKVPALREHSEDIPALVNHFSDQVVKDSGFLKKDFSPAAVQLMREHHWNGNVRELKNFIERLYILTPGEFVDVHDLRFAGLAGGEGSGASDLPSFREARAQFEKEYLVKKISENHGNISRTAEVIGLERSYLHRKIKAFGIDVQKGNDDIV